MGTHALVIVKDDKNVGMLECPIVASLYCHYDGYLDGVGKNISNFLKDMTVVNGLNGGIPKVANGMGCLAAQLISNWKTEAGNFYLTPVYPVSEHLDMKTDLFVEWIYVINKDYIEVYHLELKYPNDGIDGFPEIHEGEEIFKDYFTGTWDEYHGYINRFSCGNFEEDKKKEVA